MYRITFLNGPARGRRLTVRTGSVRIGRGPDCAVRLSDPAMADRHAEVDEQDGHPYLRNLDPLHGIEVDGRKMEAERIRLTGRERIRMGSTELRVEPMGVARRISTRRFTSGQAATAAAILALLCIQGLAILSLSSMNKPAIQAVPDTMEPEIVPPPLAPEDESAGDLTEEPPVDSVEKSTVDAMEEPSVDAGDLAPGEAIQPEPIPEPPPEDSGNEATVAVPGEGVWYESGETPDKTQRPADAIDAQR